MNEKLGISKTIKRSDRLRKFRNFAIFCVISSAVSLASAQDCSSLLCKDSFSSGKCPPGQYKGVDCTCSVCPEKGSVTDWKFQCLTIELDVCPKPRPPPSDKCDFILCSNSKLTCSDSGRYPDSACICVTCPHEGASDKSLMTCLNQAGFCLKATPSPTTAATNARVENCTEEELQRCTSCELVTRNQSLHYPNGTCQACPHDRSADKPSHCGRQLNAGEIVGTVFVCLAFVVLVICGALYWFKCRQRNNKQTRNTGFCSTCQKPVANNPECVSDDDGFCQCRMRMFANHDQRNQDNTVESSDV